MGFLPVFGGNGIPVPSTSGGNSKVLLVQAVCEIWQKWQVAEADAKLSLWSVVALNSSKQDCRSENSALHASYHCEGHKCSPPPAPNPLQKKEENRCPRIEENEKLGLAFLTALCCLFLQQSQIWKRNYFVTVVPKLGDIAHSIKFKDDKDV